MRITIIGSTYFHKQWREVERSLTLQGHRVDGLIEQSTKDIVENDPKAVAGSMIRMAAVQLSKIVYCDCVYVLNVNDLIGEGTALAIEFAASLDKDIVFHSDADGGYPHDIPVFAYQMKLSPESEEDSENNSA